MGTFRPKYNIVCFVLSSCKNVLSTVNTSKEEIQIMRSLSLRSSLFRFLLAGESESQGEVARTPGARALARLPLAWKETEKTATQASVLYSYDINCVIHRARKFASRRSANWNDTMNHAMFGAQLEHNIFHGLFYAQMLPIIGSKVLDIISWSNVVGDRHPLSFSR